MNCLDCARVGESDEAVAVCGRCGAGLCLDHAHESSEMLTSLTAINRQIPIETPARRLRCPVCHAAETAQAAWRAA